MYTINATEPYFRRNMPTFPKSRSVVAHDINKKVQDTLDLIKEADQIINNSTYEDVVLVLGNSGVGKTAFTKWMTEDNSKLISERSGLGQPYLMRDNDNKIGNSTITSATVFPDLFVNKTINQAYYDFPGFHDTRGVSYGIATMYSIQGVISRTKSIKMVFLVGFDSVKTAGDRSGFTDLMETNAKFINDIGKFSSSISLVVSKIPKYINDEQLSNDQVIHLVADFIRDEVKPKLERGDNTYYTQTIKFIDTILSKNGDDYPKIGLFRLPDKAGPFSDIPIVQRGKERIEKLIYEKLNFTPIAKDDFISTIDAEYQTDIANIVEEIKYIITSNVETIGEKIKQHYLHIEETVADIAQLYDKTSAGYYELLETQKNATSLTSMQCIELVSKNSAAINSNITGNTLLDTTKSYAAFLEFLDTNNFSRREIHQFKCTTGLDKTVEYLKDTKTWYGFLNNLYDRLSDYEIQKNTGTCNKLANNISTQYEDNTIVADINLEPFLAQCYSNYDYSDIKDIALSQAKINILHKLLRFTLNYPLNHSCDSKNLKIEGHYVKLSDINKYTDTCTEVQSISIFALDKVFIDSDVDKTGQNIAISIIAPTWNVLSQHKIVLDGLDAKAHSPRKAENILEGFGAPGTDGKPGAPGGPGGNFFGIGSIINDANGLTIYVNGGKGSPGQDGGDGMKGKDGIKPEIRDKEERQHEVFGGPDYKPRKQDGVDIEDLGDAEYYTCLKHYSGNCYLWKLRGDNCTSGGNGGNGGRGGHGGKPGTIALTFPSIIQNRKEGQEGRNGAGGSGGKPGETGQEVEVYTYMSSSDFIFSVTWYAIIFKITKGPIDFPCAQGHNGIEGNTTEEVEEPKMLPYHEIVNSYKEYLINNLPNDFIKSTLLDFQKILEDNEAIKYLASIRHRRDIDNANKQIYSDDHNDNVSVASSAGGVLKPIGYNLVNWVESSITRVKQSGLVKQITSWFQQYAKSTKQSQLDIVDYVYQQDNLSVESSDNIMGIEDDMQDEYLSERVYHGLLSGDSSLSPTYSNYDFNINGSLTLANLIMRMITGIKYDNNHILNKNQHNSENIDYNTHRMIFGGHVSVENSTHNMGLLG